MNEPSDHGSSDQENPFRPPEAEIDPVFDGSGWQQGELQEPRALPANRGWGWFADSWPLFMANPWLWIGLLLVAGLCFIAISMVPVVSLFGGWLVPMFMGGWVVCCHRLVTEGEFKFEDLFAPFSQQFKPMAILSLIYMGLNLLVTVIAFAVGAGIGLALGFGFGAAGGGEFGAFMLAALVGFLIGMALFVPLLMAIWFAPALVMLHQVQPIEAMKISVIACWRNIVPFLLYGLVGTGLLIIGAIPLLLGWLVVYPLMFNSVYVAYREIFLAEND